MTAHAAESWNRAHAHDLATIAVRFIERGDALAAIAALSRAIEALVGEAAKRERLQRTAGDEVRG